MCAHIEYLTVREQELSEHFREYIQDIVSDVKEFKKVLHIWKSTHFQPDNRVLRNQYDHLMNYLQNIDMYFCEQVEISQVRMIDMELFRECSRLK